MANETVARRYAAAVFALAHDAHGVDEVGQDLEKIGEAIRAQAMTRAFFLAPVIDRKEKERVLLDAFEGKIHELALHTLLLLVRKRREALLDELLVQYGELEMKARGVRPLTVTSARELAPAQLRQMVEQLEHRYATRFDVTQKVDPGLIGGVRIMMGDRRIDASVSGRLDKLSRVLSEQVK